MKIFAKRIYSFNPIEFPFICFDLTHNSDALITASTPGDLLVLVGTEDSPTLQEDRGRMLGIVEFGRITVDLERLTDRSRLLGFHLQADGSLALPKGLPILRAWSFPEPRLKLIDVLREQLTFDATIRAVLLRDYDSKAVLAIPRSEIAFDPLRSIQDMLEPHQVAAEETATTGPLPSSWETKIIHSSGGEAWTYALQFGTRNIWKVGWTQDTDGRTREINQHVPFESIGERWILRFRQRWATCIEAYDMEQRILDRLQNHRTSGERVGCTQAEFQTAWAASLIQSES